MTQQGKGSLEVICGSMFSGKTEELMRRLKRAEYAKRSVLTVKPHIDTRCSVSCILSHDGNQREAHSVEGIGPAGEEILRLVDDTIHIIGIDEVQFFAEPIIAVIDTLILKGKRVICAGLDMDFRGEPFGVMPLLMAKADSVDKVRAICMVCGGDAIHSQRLLNGKPARHDDATILVGAEECYEARCRECFVSPMQGAPTVESTVCHTFQARVGAGPSQGLW